MATDRKVWDLAGPSPVTMVAVCGHQLLPAKRSSGHEDRECGVSPAGEVLAHSH